RLFPLSPLNRRLLAVGCELSCRLTPLFATLAGSMQTAENIATISPFFATLTRNRGGGVPFQSIRLHALLAHSSLRASAPSASLRYLFSSAVLGRHKRMIAG